VTAVASVDLQVEPGTAVALVGGNGAGKSSTLRVLAGVVPPTTGTVRVTGIDVAHDPSGVRHATGYCPDVGGTIPRATPWEHFQLAARLRGMSGWEPRAQDLIERFDLGAAAYRVTAGFSHGMGRRLSVALAAFHRPPVLLLDEPFDGVDPLGVDATVTEVGALLDLGTTVVVSTHLLDLALRIADRAVVLRTGRVVAQEAAATLAGTAGADHYRSLLA
jgi:ABC-2 type transport system ATP-binding protein